MRIYIIGNDGITLYREAPESVTDGEIAVASKEELHAAPLNGKRLLGRGQDHRLPYNPDCDLTTQVRQSIASSLERLPAAPNRANLRSAARFALLVDRSL